MLTEFFANIYQVLTKSAAVYLFQLVPIAYFMTIISRLLFYKIKYRVPIYFRDIISLATTLVIVVDYVNYLRLLITGTGKMLPAAVLFTKYTIGFLLWTWMFWYSYQVHVRNAKHQNGKESAVTARQAVLLFVGSMIVILVVIGLAVS